MTCLQVPFLSVGDDLHCSTVRHKGTSELSGDYVIEDVESDGSVYRRLVFLTSQAVVQTEAKLLQGAPQSQFMQCYHWLVFILFYALVIF